MNLALVSIASFKILKHWISKSVWFTLIPIQIWQTGHIKLHIDCKNWYFLFVIEGIHHTYLDNIWPLTSRYSTANHVDSCISSLIWRQNQEFETRKQHLKYAKIIYMYVYKTGKNIITWQLMWFYKVYICAIPYLYRHISNGYL